MYRTIKNNILWDWEKQKIEKKNRNTIYVKRKDNHS